jgi:single-stranded-DNA-specific exonuclease
MTEFACERSTKGARAALAAAGCDPRLARLFRRARRMPMQASSAPRSRDCTPRALARIDEAARLLADAIARGRADAVVADYDADGATAARSP